ncbi:MAG: DUF6114 domain-containing protein [Candidatus Bathyarchaeia archaeon]
MSRNERPMAACVLSFAAGSLILFNVVLLGVIRSFIVEFGIAGLIPPSHFYITTSAVALLLLNMLMAAGAMFGVIVLLGASMLYRNPSQKRLWGIVISVFSTLSIVVGGGVIVGFVLGVVGGFLALTWKPNLARIDGELGHTAEASLTD